MNVHLFMKQRGQDGLVLARFIQDGAEKILHLARQGHAVHLLDHTGDDDPEDVKGLTLESLVSRAEAWLAKQKLDPKQEADILASIKAKLQIPKDPTT